MVAFSNLRAWVALLVTLIAAGISTGLLFLTVGVYGTVEGMYDSANYLSGAYNLAHGNGFSLKMYKPSSDTLVFQPITHYPPMTSLVYAFFLVLGVPLIFTPSWTVVCCWLLFLAGLGVLTYRLSESWWGGAMVVIIASVTHSFMHVFQLTMSEPVFLPLLVWSVALLVDLPHRQLLPRVRVAAVVVLLALMLLTRYASVVLFGAIVLWWAWVRFRQQQVRRLLWEVPLWLLAAVPLAGWLVRNRLVSETVVGLHKSGSTDTFWDGASAVINQVPQLVVPALGPIPKTPTLNVLSGETPMQANLASGEMVSGGIFIMLQVATLGIVFLLGRQIWKVHKRCGQPLALPSSPVLPMVAAFLALYIVVQPFASFWPMDARDSVTILCLLQPLLVAVVIRVLRQRALPVLAIYAAINLLLVVVPVVLSGVPRVVSLTPPAVHDFEGYSEPAYYRDRGIVEWLLVYPLRTTFVPRHRPELAAFLEQVDAPDLAIITNIKDALLLYEGQEYMPWRVLRTGQIREIDYWIDKGMCESQFSTFLIITHPEDVGYVEHMASKVEQTCPGLERINLREDTVVYPLRTAKE
jgi:hypothetical protein